MADPKTIDALKQNCAAATASEFRGQSRVVVPRGSLYDALQFLKEERGFDLQPTAGAVYQLLRDCHELVPGVSELEIEELCVGLRPGTPDNLPVIGAGALDGLLWATGHYRNGILLAPLTAELIAGVLSGSSPADDPLLAACAPSRFSASAAPVQAALTAVARDARPAASRGEDSPAAVRL